MDSAYEAFVTTFRRGRQATFVATGQKVIRTGDLQITTEPPGGPFDTQARAQATGVRNSGARCVPGLAQDAKTVTA